MITVHVLDQNFVLQGLIDNYESLIWRPAYYEIGDFELYIPANDKAVELLQRNRYLVRDSDITVDASGVVTYNNVMIIKNIEVTTDVEDGDYITASGRELKFIFRQQNSVENDYSKRYS